MTTDENSPLLSSQEVWKTSDVPGHDVDEEKQRRSNLRTIYMGFLGVFLASCDETLVMATYEAISSQFHSLTESAWLVTSYNLGYYVSLPVYGTLSDIYGRKKPILSAYCLFAGGCIVSGLATSLTQLVIGRVISGIGGAGMVALVSVIITDLVSPPPPGEVAVLRSYANVAAISAMSLGAPIGGLLTDTIGWGWSFIGQTPWLLCASCSRDIDCPNGHRRRRICWCRFARFAYPCVRDIGVCFLLVEQFWAPRPLIPLSLLAQGVGGYCLVQILLLCSRFGLVTNIVPYFTRTRNILGVTASALLVPTCVGFSVGSIISGHAIRRTKRYKTISIVALLICVLSYFVIFLRWRTGANLWESLYAFPSGIMQGILLSGQFVGMSLSAPKDRVATAVGAYSLSQQLGLMLGTTAASAILQGVFGRTLLERLDGLPDKSEIVNHILNDARFAFTLPPSVQETVRSSFLYGFQFVPLFSTIVCSLALPSCPEMQLYCTCVMHRDHHSTKVGLIDMNRA
ncbi:hypothetical protein VTN00DRAFT_1643 [Thermoascus crustaceus]|uniref:uncharacterized protein n=1 Tax=Thermoascus crustaceus TaxID=5088 RepID=UPI00374422EF